MSIKHTLERIYLKLIQVIEANRMASQALTQAITELTAAANAAIAAIGSTSDAEVVAALAPITASLVAAVAAAGGGVVTPPVVGQQNFTVNSVPADLSTFILNRPDGAGAIGFQFIYPGSPRNFGIAVPLPSGASSTPAQVKDALAPILSLASGTTVDGTVVQLPFSYRALSASVFAIFWTPLGELKPITGTQTGIVAS